MKKCLTLYRGTLLVVSLLMLISSLFACASPQPTSTSPTGNIESTPLTVLSVAGGEVLVMKSGASGWVSGEVGMTLGVNDKIKTAAGGHATITFFEGSTIELEGGTEISLSELGLDGTASHIGIGQQIGNTVSRVTKLVDPASSYDVETPVAIASVRGTTMSVSVASNGKTIVGNIEGQVSVTAQGVEVELPEGTTSTVLPGAPPGEPEPTATTPNYRGELSSTTPTATERSQK
jgi:ferric-dicitrate binding protein FerR (iron transport regulator)